MIGKHFTEINRARINLAQPVVCFASIWPLYLSEGWQYR